VSLPFLISGGHFIDYINDKKVNSDKLMVDLEVFLKSLFT
jgi:hypothetical protein